MAYNHEYPYVDPNRYNSDWILHRIMELDHEMSEFEALNKITWGGAWNITQQYPAWTIVVVNGNTGYISTQPVPTGVNITNTDYWRLIADFSTLMADLAQRVGTLEGEMQIANADIDTLQAEVATLANRYFLFVSDSFGVITDNWIDPVVTSLGLSNDQYTVIAEGGIGFCNPGNNTGYTLELLVKSILDTWTADELEAVTDVVVVAGCNDTQATYDNSFGTAVQGFCNYIKATLPNAKIIGGYNGTYIGGGHADRSEFKTARRNVMNRFIAASGIGSTIANLDFLLNAVNVLNVDGVHPNAVGALIIGCAVCNAINHGGEFTYSYTNSANGFSFNLGGRFVFIHADALTPLYQGTAITLNPRAFYTVYPSGTSWPTYPKAGRDWYFPVVIMANNNGVNTMFIGFIRLRPDGTMMLFNPSDTTYASVTSMHMYCVDYVVDTI